MTLQQQKVMRMGIILESVAKVTETGSSVNKEKLVAECIMRWGTARRTVLEYLTVLAASNKIQIVGNHIRSTPKGIKEEANKEASSLLMDYLPEKEDDKKTG